MVIVEPGTRELRAVLHVDDTLKSAWVNDPKDASKRVLVPFHALQGAHDGDSVLVRSHASDQHSTGEIVSTVDELGDLGDELDELNDLWTSRATSQRAQPSPRPLVSTAPRGLDVNEAPFATEAIPTERVSFAEYLPPVIVTLGSATIRCGLVYDLDKDAPATRPSVVDALVVGRPLFSTAQVHLYHCNTGV